MYRYTVLLYTTYTMLLYNLILPKDTCGAHTMIGSVVLLYVYTVVKFLYACTINLFWPMRALAL